jgi:Helicase associated domain
MLFATSTVEEAMNDESDNSTIEWVSACSSSSSSSNSISSSDSASATESDGDGYDDNDSDFDETATLCATTTAKSNGRRHRRRCTRKAAAAAEAPEVPIKKEAVSAAAVVVPLSNTNTAFSSIDAAWEAKFALAQEFAAQQGHCRIPTTHVVLGDWVRSQRKRYARLSKQQQDPLKDAKLQRLHAIGFGWDGTADFLAQTWERNYGYLVEFHRIHGHALVPRRYPTHPILSYWVGRQRRYYRQGKLKADQIRRLQEIDFCWDRQQEIAAQRQERRIVVLPTPRASVQPEDNPDHDMDTAAGGGGGVVSLTPAWDRHLAALRDFAAEFGHARVPRHYAPNAALGTWVRRLRSQHRTGRGRRLSQSQCDALNALGFCWNATTTTATDKVQASSGGDSKRPATRPTRTATTQRTAAVTAVSAPPPRKRDYGAVSTRRHGRRSNNDDDDDDNEGVGVVVVAIAPAWYAQLVRLRQFREAHGHCRVPYGYEPDPSLALWVSRMRKVLSSSSSNNTTAAATTKKRALLDELGFCWNPRAEQSDPNQRDITVQWLERFAQLQTFRDIHGHCIVPVRGVVDRNQVSLGRWVTHQRVRWSNGNISNEEVRRLDSLGFCWGGVQGRYTGTIVLRHTQQHGPRVRVLIV